MSFEKHIAKNIEGRHLFHICGKKGSGKSTLLSFFKSDNRYTTEIRFHLEKAIINDDFKTKKIPTPFYWTDEMIELCYQNIKLNNVVFLTGLYHQKELDFFSKEYNIHKIGITIEDNIRHDRLIKRYIAEHKTITKDELIYKDKKRDGSEKGFENADINSLINNSEIILENNKDIYNFKKEYFRLVTHLEKTYAI